MSWQIIQGDCIEVMAQLPERSINLVLTDPPYGTTQCKWDAVIPFTSMWNHLNRIVQVNTAIVFCAAQPFSSALVLSNIAKFKYEWVWDKKNSSGYLNAKKRPMARHEVILVFSNGTPPYFPQMRIGKFRQKGTVRSVVTENYNAHLATVSFNDQYYPTSIIEISNAQRLGKVHPTEKPIDLMRYLVRTYSREGDTVLDFTCGSGSTGVACLLENRHFIGVEQDEKYVEIARQRLAETKGQDREAMGESDGRKRVSN